MINPALAELRSVVGTTAGCRLLGVARATVYRRDRALIGPRPPRPGVVSPAALSGAERAEVLAVLDSPRFVDKAPAQVWAILLDEGRYLCSVSTMYRVLRSHHQVRERRAQAAHPPRTIPELVTTGPDQVFTCYAEVVVMPTLWSNPRVGAAWGLLRSA